MVYMEVRCHNCGFAWSINNEDSYHKPWARTCQKCGKEIDRQTWERQVLPALGACIDANFELARDSGQNGKFTINVYSGE